jgi:diadenosine tetraphosphate (Ap4A) HIT family hydrolase
MSFTLHAQLAADTIAVTTLGLSSVRLMDDRTWPWIVLVPERADAVELLDLSASERGRLMQELALASAVVRDLFQPHKLNVAALGNQVPQLHVHVIGRFRHDPAWPGPIWGALPRQPYPAHERETTVAALVDGFERNRGLYLPDDPAPAGEEPKAAGLWGFLGFTDR